MKAAQAHRLAANVKAGKIKRSAPPTELDFALHAIKSRAAMGDLEAYFNLEYINEAPTIHGLRELGYLVEWYCKSPNATAKWWVSWEKKERK